MTQTFLETGQHRLLVTRFDINDTIRRQTYLRERWREQIGLGHAPQHFACCACGDTGCEQRRRRSVDSALAAPCNFMQAPQRQSALRQPLVDDVHAKWQDDVLAC
jgi:hypothetical protein